MFLLCRLTCHIYCRYRYLRIHSLHAPLYWLFRFSCGSRCMGRGYWHRLLDATRCLYGVPWTCIYHRLDTWQVDSRTLSHASKLIGNSEWHCTQASCSYTKTLSHLAFSRLLSWSRRSEAFYTAWDIILSLEQIYWGKLDGISACTLCIPRVLSRCLSIKHKEDRSILDWLPSHSIY